MAAKTNLQKTTSKIEAEKKVIRKMIELYCVAKHGSPKGEFCPECSRLVDYSFGRIDACPFKDTKSFCSSCVVHCYEQTMREQIRIVMRYSGPRMLFHHPIIAIRHLRTTLKEKRTDA